MKHILTFALATLAVAAFAQQTAPDRLQLPNSQKPWRLVTDQVYHEGQRVWVDNTPTNLQGADLVTLRNATAWAPLSPEIRGDNHDARLRRRHPNPKHPLTDGVVTNWKAGPALLDFGDGQYRTNFWEQEFNGTALPLQVTRSPFPVTGYMHHQDRMANGQKVWALTWGFMPPEAPLLRRATVRHLVYQAVWNGYTYTTDVLVDEIWAAAWCGNFFPTYAARTVTVARKHEEQKPPEQEKQICKEIIREYYRTETIREIYRTETQAPVFPTTTGGTWLLKATGVQPADVFNGMNFIFVRWRSNCGPILTCDPNGGPPPLPGPLPIGPPGTPPNNVLNSDPDFGIGNPPPTGRG